jgi:hypothetical protein
LSAPSPTARGAGITDIAGTAPDDDDDAGGLELRITLRGARI